MSISLNVVLFGYIYAHARHVGFLMYYYYYCLLRENLPFIYSPERNDTILLRIWIACT